ncbi:MAG: ATP-binding protein [Rhizomicrobium sp.]
MNRGIAAFLAFGALAVLGAPAVATAPVAPASVASTPAPGSFDALIADAKKTMMADPKAALQIVQQAQALAERGSGAQGEGVATSLWLEAEALTRLDRMAEAKAALGKAIAIAGRDGKITKLDGDIALAQARIAQNDSDMAQALKCYQRAHDIFAKLGELRSQSIALQGLGAIYDLAHDFNREIRYYREASQVYSADPALELSVANNVGIAMQQLGRYGEAVTNFKRALTIARTMKSPFLEAWILTNLAYSQAKSRDFADATKTADKALAILGKSDARGEAAFAWGVKAEIAFEQGHAADAAHDMDKAFHGVDLKTTIAPFRDIHQIAYQVYRAVGNYQLALAHLEAFKRLDDEGRELTASTNLALTGAQFDFARQRFEIEHLRSEQLKRDISLRESRAATQTVIFTAVLAGIAILMLWIGWRLMLLRRHRNAIAQKNVALTQTLGERDVEIGRRTEVEAHLRLATTAAEEANRAKSHFLANMSHELRTPLNAIIGFSELVAHGIAAGDKAREYAHDINTSGQNLLIILNDILDMARIDAGTVTLEESEIGLAAIVADSIAETERSAGAHARSIVLEDAAPGLRVRGDDTRLRQIVVNLLSNAVKFTGDDGRIAVRVEAVEDGADIVVTDNGIGIPQDKLDTVMEPFGQAESAYARLHGGVGLGLPIVKSLVQLHGGRFTLTSEPGAGTQARVHLPSDRVLRVPPRAASTAAR